MDLKAKLVELLEKSLFAYVGKSCRLAENIASDLIANGVTVQVEPKSDADRIRAMSDEELAAQLTQVFCDGFTTCTDIPVPDKFQDKVMAQFLEQLQQPAEEPTHDR